jgi:hypothetical protein
MNFVSRILAYSDVSPTGNPKRRLCDWSRDLLSLPVCRPINQVFELQPLEEVEVFDGTRDLFYDETTEFSLNLLSGTKDLYRLAWTGTGTAPVFRVDRALGLTDSIVVTPQSNLTVLVTNVGLVPDPSNPSGPEVLGNKASFSGVQVGDSVYIPGITTNDTALFNPMNEGYWTVLGVSSDHTTLALGRTPGTVYEAASDDVALTDAAQFQVFSCGTVQIGDTLDLIAGFSAQAIRSYEIIRVTASSVDIRSSIPLTSEVVTCAGVYLNIYSSAKTFVALETNQEIAVKMNANTDESCRVEPILADGVCGKVGLFQKFGTVYWLSLKNRSTAICTVTLISVE